MVERQNRFWNATRRLLKSSLLIALWHTSAVSASTLLGKVIQSSSPAENTAYGYSLSISGHTAAVGVPYFENFTGAVLAYRLDDPDSDGIAAVDDNCPLDYNPTQANYDGALLGDVCDPDDDNDSVEDDKDTFPFDPSRQDPVDANSGEAPIARLAIRQWNLTGN